MRYLTISLLLSLSACIASPVFSEDISTVSDQLQNNKIHAKTIRIAVMPDIHFHDVYATFSDLDFSSNRSGHEKISRENQSDETSVVIRSMSSQLTSTRLFNENYFAFLAALDDAVARDVKIIALPGDFSDDGQALHLRGLATLLKDYQQKYGIRFFAAPGNHDPVKPYTSPGGEPDFLQVSGAAQGIFSPDSPQCLALKKSPSALVLCSQDVRHLGYNEILEHLNFAGFFPDSHDQYWETPYSPLSTQSIKSNKNSSTHIEFAKRGYEICRQGTGGVYKQSHYTDCKWVPDASYLVEPVEGLWLLAIDANVYIPTKKSGADLQGFSGSGNAGYNALLTHKTHLLEWITSVVERANQDNKTLIAFSHFPMTDFYHDQSDRIAALFGDTRFQLQRKPQQHVSQALAETGLKLHIGGHMHFNDAGWVTSQKNHQLLNVQAPSLAAHVPAYTLVTIDSSQQAHIETIVIDKVDNFNALFPLYRQEHNWLQRHHPDALWDDAILESKNYRAFTEQHLRALVQNRFIPNDWPTLIQDLWKHASGYDLLKMSFISEASLNAYLSSTESNTEESAKKDADKFIEKNALNKKDFTQWQAIDLAVDFYKIANTGPLALSEISLDRLRAYQLLQQAAQNNNNELSHFLAELLDIMFAMNTQAAEPITLDLQPQVKQAPH